MSNFLSEEILISFYVKLIIFIMSVQIRMFGKISVSVLFSFLISFTPYITLLFPFFMYALREFSLSLFIYLYIYFFSYLFIFYSFFRQLSSSAPFSFQCISLYLLFWILSFLIFSFFLSLGEVEELFSKLPEYGSEKMKVTNVYPNRVKRDSRFSKYE